jgi:hypothetical protein
MLGFTSNLKIVVPHTHAVYIWYLVLRNCCLLGFHFEKDVRRSIYSAKCSIASLLNYQSYDYCGCDRLEEKYAEISGLKV